MAKQTTKKEVPQEDIDKGGVFEVFDKADEDQVEQELKGAVPEEMVYSFSAGGQKVEGLSAHGVKEAMRAYNKTALQKNKPFILIEGNTKDRMVAEGIVFVDIVAKLIDSTGRSLEQWVGSANQPLTAKSRTGSYADPFAAPKATTKAQRNAIRGLLPDELIKKLITKWSKQDRVRRFMGAGAEVPEMDCENCKKPLSLKARQYYNANPNRILQCNCPAGSYERKCWHKSSPTALLWLKKQKQ
jgi:hypothetical protein